ncbi:hypothetical protein JRO89_XS04G0224900 [Xanthoceras sorbifolium]|uniref:RING-type E3 ubiquitin transferase n=1 Tax=Xanthoceras sorbifolium TaxID=99658 RepID=A0ABQ8I6I0_9ROSI|nr:hypothetical protein JRO89_XS04G0224900 [Xanthoceras sorbifolium]
MATAYQIDLSFDLDEVLDMNLGHQITTTSHTSEEANTPKDSSHWIRASNTLVSSLPTVAATDDVCSVCMEDFQTQLGFSGKQVPCGHVFHATCITTWLSMFNSCPLCRSPCIIPGDQDTDDRFQ